MSFSLALAVLGLGACEKHRFEDTKILYGAHDDLHGDEKKASEQDDEASETVDESPPVEGEGASGVARDVGI